MSNVNNLYALWQIVVMRRLLMNSFITSTRIEEAGRMKKVLVLVTLLLGIGFIAGCMNSPSKERMNEELKKPEVVEIIEEAIKKRDSKALTEAGKITGKCEC